MGQRFICSIIIVNYNGRHFLQPCLGSIRTETKGIPAEVYFVDNNSADGSCEFVLEKYPEVNVIRNKINVGFAAACNRAIDLSLGRYILLLNPDTIMMQGSLRTMVEILEKNPGAGASAFKLLNSDGSLQFSIGNFPNLVNQLLESLFLHRIFPSLNFAGELVLDKKRYDRFHEIDWAFGAGLIIRSTVFEKIGKLDEGFFFGAEEKDLCYRIKQAGWKILFVPWAEIIHHGRGWREDFAIDNALIQGRIRFAKKHCSRFQQIAFRIILLSNLGIRLLLWMIISSFSAKNRVLARKRFIRYRTTFNCCLNEYKRR